MSRVLVIDDDPDSLDGLACVLRLAGFEVTTAHNGDTLLAGRGLSQLVHRSGAADARSAPNDAPGAAVWSEAHAAARWANAVMPVFDSPRDPRTLADWSRCAAASPGTLKNWCRTARLSPRRSLVLARLLRVVLRRPQCGHAPHDLLDVVDRRTVAGLLRLAGIATGNPADLPDDAETFLENQSLIRDPAALAELRRALRRRRPAG